MATVQDIAIELKTLEKENGALLPEDVVDAARDPDSPMHDHFTWDDNKAAEKQRLHEARALIRRIHIEVSFHDMSISVPRYVRDPEAAANQAGYRDILKIKSEEDTARAVIIDEMERVKNAVNRAKRIATVLGIESDLEKINDAVKTLAEKIETQVGGSA